MLLILACAGLGDCTAGSGSKGPAETRSGTEALCPSDMVAVTHPDGALAFCIDRYEVVVDGELGDVDQLAPDALATEARAEALIGELAAFDISWTQARAICENSGKRLPTSQEWEDAADGVVGPGGSAYPYGKTFDEERCVCLSSTREVLYEDPQPTGSLPSCVSAFGTFDQSGNLFEWADPQRSFDIEAWFATRDDVTREGRRIRPEALTKLWLDVAGIDPTSLALGEGGLVAQAGDGWQWQDGNAKGVLINQGTGELLPVEVAPLGPIPGPAEVLVLLDFDGQPMADKRGGSYYSGTDIACRVDASYLGHLHDFKGDIGFRCAWSP